MEFADSIQPQKLYFSSFKEQNTTWSWSRVGLFCSSGIRKIKIIPILPWITVKSPNNKPPSALALIGWQLGTDNLDQNLKVNIRREI